MEAFLIYLAIGLGVMNAIMPLIRKIVSKTKNKSDDKVVEIIEEALLLAKGLQAEKSSLEAAKKKSA